MPNIKPYVIVCDNEVLTSYTLADALYVAHQCNARIVTHGDEVIAVLTPVKEEDHVSKPL